MTHRICFCSLAIALCLWSSLAIAAPLNSYKLSFGQDVFTVMPGKTVEVPVYFQETVGSEDTSVLAPGGIGLVTAGVQVAIGAFPQPTEPARILAAADIIPNPAFDFTTQSHSLNGAKLTLAELEGPPVHGEEYAPGVYRLLLGTFRFTAGNVPGESTPLVAGQCDPGFANFVTDNETVLDPTPLPQAGATITVVPEPCSLALLAIAVFAAAAQLFRLRKS